MNRLKRAITILELCIVELTLAQDASFFVGNYEDEFKVMKTMSSRQESNEHAVITLRLSDEKSLDGEILFEKLLGNEVLISGKIKGDDKSSFFISMKDQAVEGHVFLEDGNTVYRYYSLEGNVYVEKTLKDEIICTEYDFDKNSTQKFKSFRKKGDSALDAVPSLNSLSKANGVVLLDFDGQEVVGTRWLSGRSIKAESFNYTSEEIKLIWEIVSEDFTPININITTDESEFNKYPKNKRMRCIITPTNVIAPQSGGVAFVNSFVWNDDTPCWVFVDWPENTGEIISHEIGHTLGLSHDGDNENEYYTGHADWAPIMGKSYGKKLTQWSKGEYANATNTEDDLERITREFMGLGYVLDDHSDDFIKSTHLKIDESGKTYADANWGIISKSNDKDYFSFVTSGGHVDVSVNVSSKYSNLRLKVTLYNKLKEKIKVFDVADLAVGFSDFLDAGEYYICVEGVGSGDAVAVYSNYGSLGKYFIVGSIPVTHYTLLPEDKSYWSLPFVIASEGSDSKHQFLGGVNQDYIASLQAGEWFEFFVEIKENGYYEVQPFLSKKNKGEFEIWVDHEKVTRDNYTNFSLDTGMHDIRFEVIQSGLTVDKITFSSVSVDCNYVINGLAFLDDCGVCVGGNTTLKPCINTFEAENGCVSTGGTLDSSIRDFSGTGYFNFSNQLAASGKWFFVVENDLTTNMVVRYANGNTTSRNMALVVNGELVREFTFGATGNWWDWKNTSQLIDLKAGYNTLELVSLTETGGPNVDWFSFSELNVAIVSCEEFEQITCEDQNGDGYVDCDVTSLNENIEVNLSVYPNPVIETLSIEQLEQEFTSFQLTNTFGEVYVEDRLEKNHFLELTDLHQGVYVLTLLGENRIKQVSLIKQ